ncbi:electron transfer flavoprotein subunit beta/FixA family protein [Capnocytophaga felis]|uniref:Electron transfer flavoprotein subunit beta n=1 Tax=Capnocytophaga felis TaxID=2267611 RepID=A0A5M4B6F1_9FLAO|nr:electron transfer flavoprotein subunit beta/FixA family protein [Capnocytophaga felis]GET44910.1 electron transfer flavoprotein subunit alpha [Capnocytophaga felis]GET49362.1 electron transfer flavoprotein subunit alpha [Capnocytophaga felis]
MKILVCISSVPDTTSKINFTDENRKFDSNGVQFIINPNDEYGLTKAIILKEKLKASITLVNVGTAETEPTLRKAFALGADDIIRVNAVASDGFFVASQIAKIAKEGNYNLIITGKESIDYNGGMVGGMIAALLDYPFVNKCTDLEIDGNSVSAEREIDGGKEKIAVKLPVVIAGQKGLVHDKDLRIPNMRNLMAARTKQITVVEAENSENKTKTIGFEKLPAKQPVKMISPDNLDELINLLHNEAKVI